MPSREPEVPEAPEAPEAEASGTASPRSYDGRRVTVTFESGRCLHAAECVRGLPEVFDTARRPWIRPDGADPERVAEVVRRCPSGALRYRLAEGPAEPPDRPTTVVRSPSGQFVVRGELNVTAPDGTVRAETRVMLCACGASAGQPYCDHSGPCGTG
ncbi:(4Fe-4S)-binding protein [Streptomyces sp. NPDC051567]|uniref:(4Fe-4S)-binding protein n=1 Tax=Streptomyces sp. NPDC051567 TaxID=3365660 RepID=UPI0037B7137D